MVAVCTHCHCHHYLHFPPIKSFQLTPFQVRPVIVSTNNLVTTTNSSTWTPTYITVGFILSSYYHHIVIMSCFHHTVINIEQPKHNKPTDNHHKTFHFHHSGILEQAGRSLCSNQRKDTLCHHHHSHHLNLFQVSSTSTTSIPITVSLPTRPVSPSELASTVGR